MNAFDQYEVWFVTGAQLLYGGDVVVLLDEHGKEFRSVEFANWIERKPNTCKSVIAK